MIVSFVDFNLVPRFDRIPWTRIQIEESAASDGPWSIIDTQIIDPVDEDPSHPVDRSFTTDNATLTNGWYRISFLDESGNKSVATPVYNAALATEIMASLNDINAELDGEVVEANSDNSALVQINVSRMIRGYLSKVLSAATLVTWDSPDDTPDIIRVCAAKFIAAQVYFNYAARTSLEVGPYNFAQRRYDEAMAILNGIIAGTIDIGADDGGGGVVVPAETIGALDFFPQDATDRAFRVGMPL